MFRTVRLSIIGSLFTLCSAMVCVIQVCGQLSSRIRMEHLFWHETEHVLDSSSVQHQEFIHFMLSNGMCHTVLWTVVEQDQDGTPILA